MVGVYWCCMIIITFCIVLYVYINVLYYCIAECLWRRRKERKDHRRRRKKEKDWRKRNTPLALCGMRIRLVGVWARWRSGRHVWVCGRKVTSFQRKSYVVLVLTLRRLALIKLYEFRNVNNWMYKVWDMKELNVGSFQWFICLFSIFTVTCVNSKLSIQHVSIPSDIEYSIK